MVGIIAIKTQRTQIHFLSDVLVVVSSLDLKVPNNNRVTPTVKLVQDKPLKIKHCEIYELRAVARKK